MAKRTVGAVRERRLVGSLLLVCGMVLAGCAPPGGVLSGRVAAGTAEEATRVLGRNEHYAVVQVGTNDDLQSLARRFLGDPRRAWMITDANGTGRVDAGGVVVVPLRNDNPVGIYADGFQKVPILSYHRFGEEATPMTLPPALFRQQMQYLKEHDYRVVPLIDLVGFLRGQAPMPRRGVVLTADDGYRSFYEIAYPILREYGYPATLFVYTDYINRGGVRWEEIEEMRASGLISVQPHSKTHGNLAVFAQGETPEAYRRRVEEEVAVPAALLSERTTEPAVSYAYPFGDANDLVIDRLRHHGYMLGVTVQRGGNAAFSPPFRLRRSMIFGHLGMDGFIAALDTFEHLHR